MRLVRGNRITWKKRALSYIVYHKSHMNMPGIEVGPLWLSARAMELPSGWLAPFRRKIRKCRQFAPPKRSQSPSAPVYTMPQPRMWIFTAVSISALSVPLASKNCVAVNSKLEGTWQQAALVYFKELPQYQLEETGECQGIPQSGW
jgi:hypothetical protein